jgi:putative endopeptidase
MDSWSTSARLVLSFVVLSSSILAQSAPNKPVFDVGSMDLSLDPCVDFYAYSCGSWLRNNPIPPDQTSWGVSSKLQEENQLLLRTILEKAADPLPKRDAVTQKIGDYYSACMNEKAAEAAGIEPLQAALDRIAGAQSKPELEVLMAQTVYDNPLFDLRSSQDYKNSNLVIAEVDQAGLGLPDRDFYLLGDAKWLKFRKAYVAHVRKMFDLVGDTPEAARNEAKSVLRIETALAKGSMSRVDRNDPRKVYHKMSVAELEALSPSFPWSEYFTAAGLPTLAALNVTATGFFKTMDAELRKEGLESWKAYLRWHVVHANAPFLSAAFVEAGFDFYGKTLNGAQAIEPRWKRCVSYTDNDLGEALGQVYVEQAFSPEAKQRVLKMTEQLEDAMQREIEDLPWMTIDTKRHAVEKLSAVANKIGYPDKWRDYGALAISRDDALGNVRRSREFEFHWMLGKIGKPADRAEWAMTPPTVNAYYDAQMNDINFPAGILLPPLFDPASDSAPNYGDTGSTIGHELTHGFDDEGRRFDSQGNLRDWWTAEDAKEFEQRASCLTDQYSHYTAVDRFKVNGKLTLGENIADLGGVILAYMAWKEETKGQKLEPIEGFTPEQRFFIGYGQSWCTNTREETRRLQVTADVHSPEQYRANGVVSNLPEFQQAFHCKAGSPMVRKNQCRVW